MLQVDEALARVLAGVAQLGDEEVSLAQAAGRVIAERVLAARALPSFDNSAMDGYAVRAADAVGPVTLRVVAEVPAGARELPVIGPGEAARIFTGAPLPPGTDAIVMQEDVGRDGEGLVLAAAVAAGAHVRKRGEDVAVGAIVLEPGVELRAGEIGMLAAQGRGRVRVVRRPRVVILSSGDELIDLDGPAGAPPSSVVNSNAYMLAAQVREAGGAAERAPIVRDDPDAIRAALDEAAGSADLLLTCGGMSVGDHDHMSHVLGAGGEIAFHKVAMKPGKPIAFGRWRGVPLLGLPGNPVSAFVGFELFGRPALRKLGGQATLERPRVCARLSREVTPNPKRFELLRARLITRDGELVAQLHAHQGSAALSSLLEVDALVEIPAGAAPIAAGAPVNARLVRF